MQALLEIKNLRTEFMLEDRAVTAVDDISFAIESGTILGVVGESGCGKSVTALSIMRLVQEPPGRIASGHALFHGTDLFSLTERQMQQIRGSKISMIFQDPMTALNPVFTAGDQVAEVIRIHQRASRRQARQRSIELFRQVGIPGPEERVDAYPHQMSGGMRQRVMIAIALACNPELLIADEPTTALDVTVQAGILELIRGLQAERKMAVMLITHDLGVVAETCDQVLVMYAGRIVEKAPVEKLFAAPSHPYTQGLFNSIPSIEAAAQEGGAHRLETIPGAVPSLRDLPSGCRFRERCPRATEICARVDPPLELKHPEQWAACHNPVPRA